MDFKAICRQADYNDISEDIINLIDYRCWTSLTIPKGYGKTTLLSMLYYYLDKDEDSYDLFRDSLLAKKWDKWQEHLNKRVVLVLDFNDFKAKDIVSALTYMKEKMLNLYKEKLHLFMADEMEIRHYMRELYELEKYDPATDLTITDDSKVERDWRGHRITQDGRYYLENSLKNMLSFWNFAMRKDEKAALLIDNMCLLEKVAQKNEYYHDMREFLKAFLDFEPDKVCSFYMQIWDHDSPDEDADDKYFCVSPPYLCCSDKMRWREEDKTIFYNNNKYKAKIRNPKKQNQKELDQMIVKGKILMFEGEIASLKSSEKHRIDELKRYRTPLDKEVTLYSENMGSRRMKHPVRNSKYEELNNVVRDLYDKSSDCKDFRDLYKQMQSIYEDKPTDWNDDAYTEFCNRCAEIREEWHISLNDSDHLWHQISIGPQDWYYSISDIKVYVTMRGPKVKEFLISAAEHLLRGCESGFIFKVSKVERDGTICFFVRRHDFFLLEEFVKAHIDELRKGNPFIAHRNLIGISRDLMDWHSHNANQALLLWDYFQTINDRNDIDIEEIYQMFILGWNSALEEGNIFTKDFAHATAQLFVLMMDSLDSLLGKEITDDSLLLNDDDEIWHILGHSRCWDDVNEAFRRKSPKC